MGTGGLTALSHEGMVRRASHVVCWEDKHASIIVLICKILDEAKDKSTEASMWVKSVLRHQNVPFCGPQPLPLQPPEDGTLLTPFCRCGD